MRIAIVMHANTDTLSGNRVTAERWVRILKELGHAVSINQHFFPDTELLVAIHADKSAAQVAKFSKRYPERKIVVVLSGTDIYRDLKKSKPAKEAINIADRLIALESNAASMLAATQQQKVRVIYQSAEPLRSIPAKLKSCFEISVSGHLRVEKAPFLVAQAAKRLPADSRIRITHIGKALSVEMRQAAQKWMTQCPRYHWFGEKVRWRARQLVARSQLMVNSSIMESGANSIVEALVSDIPILASRIPGNIGLLGKGYPGYFPAGDSQTLANLMSKAESDPEFYQLLISICRKHANKFSFAKEKQAWRKLLSEFD